MIQTRNYLRLKEQVKNLLKYHYSDALIMSLLWAKRTSETSIRDIQNAITEVKKEMIETNNCLS